MWYNILPSDTMKIKSSMSIDNDIIKWIDKEIEKKRFANRSHAVEFAIRQLMDEEDN